MPQPRIAAVATTLTTSVSQDGSLARPAGSAEELGGREVAEPRRAAISRQRAPGGERDRGQHGRARPASRRHEPASVISSAIGERPAPPEERQHVRDAPRARSSQNQRRGRATARSGTGDPGQRAEREHHAAPARRGSTPSAAAGTASGLGSLHAGKARRRRRRRAQRRRVAPAPYFGRPVSMPRVPMRAAAPIAAGWSHDQSRRTHQEVRRFTAVDDVSFAAEPGTGDRLPRPQRRRQDHHDAGHGRPHAGRPRARSPSAATSTTTSRTRAATSASCSTPRAQHAGRTGREILDARRDDDGPAEQSRVDEMLELVSLTPTEAKRRVRNYSLGMRQRLGIAHALLGDPPVLILDEPANGLDPAGIRWMRGLLEGYAERGGTVLLSSHLLHEVEHDRRRDDPHRPRPDRRPGRQEVAARRCRRRRRLARDRARPRRARRGADAPRASASPVPASGLRVEAEPVEVGRAAAEARHRADRAAPGRGRASRTCSSSSPPTPSATRHRSEHRMTADRHRCRPRRLGHRPMPFSRLVRSSCARWRHPGRLWLLISIGVLTALVMVIQLVVVVGAGPHVSYTTSWRRRTSRRAPAARARHPAADQRVGPAHGDGDVHPRAAPRRGSSSPSSSSACSSAVAVSSRSAARGGLQPAARRLSDVGGDWDLRSTDGVLPAAPGDRDADRLRARHAAAQHGGRDRGLLRLHVRAAGLFELGAALIGWFDDLRPWIDFNHADAAVRRDGDDGEDWAHFAVSGLIWLVLPLASASGGCCGRR